MLQSIKKLFSHSGIRYIFVGGSVFVLELGIIFIAERSGASPVLAVTLSFWIALVVSFLLQKIVSFKDRRTHRKIVAKQVIAYGALVVFNYGFTLLCISLLEQWLPTVVSRAIALAVTVIWNYFLYKTVIFKQATNTEQVVKPEKHAQKS